MPGPSEEENRNRAYRRILAAAREGGTSLDRLHELLRQLEQNESETAELLRNVYNIPEEFLAEYIDLMVREATTTGPGGSETD